MASNYLSAGRINVGLIRELARKELLECLDICSGNKALVWDVKLVGQFGLIAEYSRLKQHGVIQMLQLKHGPLQHLNVDHVIYLVRPQISLMNMIASNLKEEKKDNKEYHLIFYPRRSMLCERKLQDLGVYGSFSTVTEYTSDLFALDCDVLSMEWDTSFAECYLDNDFTSMFHAAKALMTIQALFGVIPNVYGLGKAAKLVFDLICRMRRELAGDEPHITPQIDCLLLIDRSVDLLTPFMTQLTYEGLLDEIFGINNNAIKVPPEKFVQQSANGSSTSQQQLADNLTEPKTFVLNSGEELFSKLRDKNFNAVGPTLSKSAKSLTAQFDERHKAKTVGEIKQFVDKLPHLQAARTSQSIHTSMAELIKKETDKESFMTTVHNEHDLVNGVDTDKSNQYIEDCIARQEPLVKVLRLIAIQSNCNNGLKPKIYEFYKREIFQTYGYHHIQTMNNLEKLGVIKPYGGYGNRNYNVVRKTLKLTVEAVDEQNPNDIAYVHSGYAPLSVRLAHFLANPGWRAITDLLKQFPDVSFEEIQQIPVGLRKRRNSASSIQSSVVDDQRVILVFFLGGCTFSEISALRFLSQQDDINADFIVATTKIINGKTFLQSMNDLIKTK